jgi:bis(5'-nucleosyl)-tetraphosphatase (symmetrical)
LRDLRRADIDSMSLYAIGDIQGCHTEFCQLLELIAFSPREDRLWLVGDLVNRGPDSLSVLREVKALGDAAVTVLGNHDLHLLTVAAGHARPHRQDTIAPILAAPDRDPLIEWLMSRPLVVIEGEHLLVHAGLLPQWTPATALMLSREVEAMLASERADAFLAALYGDRPYAWRDDLEDFDRLRVIVNACTRLRFCTADGTMEFSEKRGPHTAPEGFRPWFQHEARASAGKTIVCGHWSTLELKLAPNLLMLDSGCLWGGTLTAIRLVDRRVYQVPGRSVVTPKPTG